MRKCRKIGFQILAACMVVMLSGCNFSWQKEALQQGTTHLVGMENAVCYSCLLLELIPLMILLASNSRPGRLALS